MPGYSLPTAPPELSAFLRGLTSDLRDAFPGELVAIVLHGSLAMGCFYPPKSDIDLLVLVRGLTELGRTEMYERLAHWRARRPHAAGLEVSVVRTADAAHPVHPIPFLAHLGDNTSGVQARRPDGTLPVDPDLAGHFLVARTRGVSLFGPEPAAVFGEVPWNDYLASVKADLRESLEGDNILASPRYAVLNLCRWAMMQATGSRIPASKEEGALWALAHAPSEHRSLIAQALAAYRSSAPTDAGQAMWRAGGPWDAVSLRAFCDWARPLVDD